MVEIVESRQVKRWKARKAEKPVPAKYLARVRTEKTKGVHRPYRGGTKKYIVPVI